MIAVISSNRQHLPPNPLDCGHVLARFAIPGDRTRSRCGRGEAMEPKDPVGAFACLDRSVERVSGKIRGSTFKYVLRVRL